MFKNPLIVGNKGEIGKFILLGLLDIMPKALNVWCFDVNESEEERIERIKKADYIFLCVPVLDTTDWLLKYKEYLENKIIVEQCSLKSYLNDERLRDFEILSMHIMFRPSGTPNTADRNCIILNGIHSTPEFVECMEKMLQSKITCVDWDYSYHDAQMAFSQALVHRVLLVLDRTIGGKSSTYVTKKVHELAERIKAGDKELYRMIQNNKGLNVAEYDFKDLLKNFNFDEYFK